MPNNFPCYFDSANEDEPCTVILSSGVTLELAHVFDARPCKANYSMARSKAQYLPLRQSEQPLAVAWRQQSYWPSDLAASVQSVLRRLHGFSWR